MHSGINLEIYIVPSYYIVYIIITEIGIVVYK